MRSAVGLDELCFFGGLALIAFGCWQVWQPGAFLVPGCALVWISMPTRARFVASPPTDGKKG